MLNRADEKLLKRTLIYAVARRKIKRAKTIQFVFVHLCHVANHVADKEAIRAEPLEADRQKLKRECYRHEGVLVGRRRTGSALLCQRPERQSDNDVAQPVSLPAHFLAKILVRNQIQKVSAQFVALQLWLRR